MSALLDERAANPNIKLICSRGRSSRVNRSRLAAEAISAASVVTIVFSHLVG
jgi:hypothetical protein